jgi:hypothetical protein
MTVWWEIPNHLTADCTHARARQALALVRYCNRMLLQITCSNDVVGIVDAEIFQTVQKNSKTTGLQTDFVRHKSRENESMIKLYMIMIDTVSFASVNKHFHYKFNTVVINHYTHGQIQFVRKNSQTRTKFYSSVYYSVASHFREDREPL